METNQINILLPPVRTSLCLYSWQPNDIGAKHGLARVTMCAQCFGPLGMP